MRGWPKLEATQPPIDTDADGMPDTWERRYSPGGDPALKSSRDLDGDGFTNIEEYLNQTDPTVRD